MITFRCFDQLTQFADPRFLSRNFAHGCQHERVEGSSRIEGRNRRVVKKSEGGDNGRKEGRKGGRNER